MPCQPWQHAGRDLTLQPADQKSTGYPRGPREIRRFSANRSTSRGLAHPFAGDSGWHPRHYPSHGRLPCLVPPVLRTPHGASPSYALKFQFWAFLQGKGCRSRVSGTCSAESRCSGNSAQSKLARFGREDDPVARRRARDRGCFSDAMSDAAGDGGGPIGRWSSRCAPDADRAASQRALGNAV
jgi:hypothetical protein